MIITLTGANFSSSNINDLMGVPTVITVNYIKNTDNSSAGTQTIIKYGTTWTLNFTNGNGLSIPNGWEFVSVEPTSLSYVEGKTEATVNCTVKVKENSGPVTPTNYTFTINPNPTSATVTLSATGYSTVSGTGSQSIIVANGTTVNWSVSADGYTEQTGTWTISGDNKTENVVLVISDGENDSTTIRYALAPKNMVTGKLVNKTTGASEDSTSSRYNEYTVNEAWTLYADGYNASKTAKSGGVTYFNATDTYLGYDTLGEDSYGAEFEGELLTVPAGTTTVKVLSSTGKINPALYRETTGTWTAVTSDSTVVGKVTNKETGELEDSSGGRYTSYTVEDNWILCADGYASTKSAAVSYFDASGNYLGYDSLGGLSSVVFEKVTLTVPSGTTTVRVQAAAANQSMALYRLV